MDHLKNQLRSISIYSYLLPISVRYEVSFPFKDNLGTFDL